MRLPEPVWSIPISVAVGALLTMYPMPTVLSYGRPEWLTLLVIFWILNHPSRVGVWTAFFVGLLLDLLMNNTLGVYALSMSVVAYLARLSIRQARILSLPKTGFLVFTLVGLGLAIRFLVYSLVGQSNLHWQYWLPALTSACFWPFILIALQRWSRSC